MEIHWNSSFLFSKKIHYVWLFLICEKILANDHSWSPRTFIGNDRSWFVRISIGNDRSWNERTFIMKMTNFWSAWTFIKKMIIPDVKKIYWKWAFMIRTNIHYKWAFWIFQNNPYKWSFIIPITIQFNSSVKAL